jgi:hypothetical protein
MRKRKSSPKGKERKVSFNPNDDFCLNLNQVSFQAKEEDQIELP